jgi:hypothetical protein
MLTKTETSKSKAPTELEPAEYVSHVREKAAKKLRPIGGGQNTTNFDIEQNIRGIRAILAMNKEIWDRCKGSMLQASDKQSMKFRRYGFEVVEAKTRAVHTWSLLPPHRVPRNYLPVLFFSYFELDWISFRHNTWAMRLLLMMLDSSTTNYSSRTLSFCMTMFWNRFLRS